MINKMIMKKSYLIAMLFLAFILGMVACGNGSNPGSEGEKTTEDLQTVTYIPIGDLFPNPERGFYKQIDNGVALSEQTLKTYRKSNLSMILRLYYLKEFRNAPISNAVLTQFSNDMSILRKAGMKAILRFAYSSDMDELDAPLATILQHLDQLAPLFRENKDVIAVLQAGFIGAWGEWYYTTNNLNTNTARKAVLDKILEVLPADRFVQVRTPNYKRNYLGVQNAMPGSDAFSAKAIARIGHHNDCFMAGIDDYGTYTDVAADKKYLNVEGLYVPMGGETCPPSGVDPADCNKAQSEMRNLRWSYLNQDYYRGVNDNWAVQGCMEDIIRDMGYRLAMQKGDYSKKHAPGSEVSVSIKMQNLGYAPLFNPRKVELILKSADGKRTYVASLPDNPRMWQPYKVTELNAKIALPKDIAAGDYNLYLFLPDPETAIHDRPEYAVRVANLNCWEEATGYNNLGVVIKVDATSNLAQSSSSIKFVSK